MIPAILICGYLGSGKTTLINRLLSDTGGRRLTVLVNDFGGINIDKDLIRDASEGIINLENGCACCTIQDSLGTSLDQAIAMTPDAIVIEASGVALPQKMAALVDGWPGIGLAQSLTLADGLNLDDLLRNKFVAELIRDQIRSATSLLVTKADLAASAEIDRTLGVLKSLNPTGACVVGQDNFRIDALFDAVDTHPTAPHDHGHAAFDTTSVTLARSVNRWAFEEFLTGLPKDVWRVKGFVTLRDGDGLQDRYTVQRVGNRNIVERAVPKPGIADTLVFIAPKGLVELQESVDRLRCLTNDAQSQA